MNLDFKIITKDDIETISSYFDLRSNKTCDSVFLDIYLWKNFYNVKFCIDNDTLFFTMIIDNITFACMPFCTSENLSSSFEVLKNHFNNIGEKLQIYLSDEDSINLLNLNENEFKISEIFDARDYLYSANSLKELSGKKLRKKKNHINFFLREYDGRVLYKTLICKNAKEIWEFLQQWEHEKDSDKADQLRGELNGIKDILENCNKLKVTMAGIFIDDKLEAFTIGSLNKVENMAIIHIEKAANNIRGLYPYINQQFIINAFPDVTLINREDDIGLEGLRKAKLSYEPIDFARKYRIIQL